MWVHCGTALSKGLPATLVFTVVNAKILSGVLCFEIVDVWVGGFKMTQAHCNDTFIHSLQ